MLYLGSPYSHEKSVIREVRYLAVMRACAILFEQQVPVYAPILHWHQCAIMHKLPHHAEPWKVQNHWILGRSTEFGMLLLPGWEDSVGLKDEWFEATLLGLVIKGYDLNDQGLVHIGAPDCWPSAAGLPPSDVV